MSQSQLVESIFLFCAIRPSLNILEVWLAAYGRCLSALMGVFDHTWPPVFVIKMATRLMETNHGLLMRHVCTGDAQWFVWELTWMWNIALMLQWQSPIKYLALAVEWFPVTGSTNQCFRGKLMYYCPLWPVNLHGLSVCTYCSVSSFTIHLKTEHTDHIVLRYCFILCCVSWISWIGIWRSRTVGILIRVKYVVHLGFGGQVPSGKKTKTYII